MGNVVTLWISNGTNIFHRGRDSSLSRIVVRGKRAVSGVNQEDCE